MGGKMCKGRGSAPDDFSHQVEYLRSKFKLSEEKIIEYKAFFNEYSEMEKVIRRENFRNVYQILYRNDNATSFADRVFDAFDTNQDGTIDFVEFAAGLTMIDSKQIEQKISIAFSMFDEDGSNSLTLAEVIAMMEVSMYKHVLHVFFFMLLVISAQASHISMRTLSDSCL